MSDILYLGKTNFRNEQRRFGIRDDDRRRHMYVLGKSGTGKTTFLSNMAIADILEGKGICVVDPHGEFAEEILSFVPENRINDVIYFDPSDIQYPVAFNPLESVGFEMRHLVASGLMSVFRKIWPDVWSARMEYILNNTLLALLEYPDTTLLGIMRMFSDKEYRKVIVDNLQDPVVRSFWVDEFAKYTQRLETEAVSAIQNKVGQFVANPLIRNIVGQPKSSFDFRHVMDDGKIFIANLSKGKMGEDNSALLGAMVITKLQLAAMSRVDMPMSERRDFYLIVDEFQNFATDSFASILSEARKYRLNLILAHQYIEQLEESVRYAIFGNVGTMVIFRVGASDAEYLEKEFAPELEANDFVGLPNFQYYIKIMIEGVASRPFSAFALAPPPIPPESYAKEILEFSRKKFALPRAEVDQRIAKDYLPSQGQQDMQDRVDRRSERPLRDTLKKNVHKEKSSQHSHVPSGPVNVSDVKNTIRKALEKH